MPSGCPARAVTISSASSPGCANSISQSPCSSRTTADTPLPGAIRPRSAVAMTELETSTTDARSTDEPTPDQPPADVQSLDAATTSAPESEQPEPDQPAADEPTADEPTADDPESAVEAEAPPAEIADAPADDSEPVVATEPAFEPEPDPAPDVEAGPRTVGRYIADALRAAGVRYAFTVPGESFLGLLDAFEAAGIRVVATRHEGAAAFMAEAHGQLTGRPAVCLGTRAVGAANLAIGIHTARQDSAPMFVLVGQVERGLRGREAFQEVDQTATFGGLAAFAAQPRNASEVPGAVGDAIRAALVGRPGPVLLSLPEDLLDEVLPEGTELDTVRPVPPRPEPDDVRAVLQFVATARRPVI